LIRDGYRCVLSRKYDAHLFDSFAEDGIAVNPEVAHAVASGAQITPTHAAHIFPECINVNIEEGTLKVCLTRP